jgi:Protein of unknown function (DUF664)
MVSWIAPQVSRVDEPFAAGERAMLEGFLEWQRATLLHKCAGLSGGQLAERSVPPSALSLLGLVRHHAEVERTWFRRRFGGEQLPRLYWREDRPDAAFEEVSADRAEADFACLMTEWVLARRAAAGASLDEIFISDRWGQMSLRWVYLHMIEEYARHAGHADMLRERIDGTTGS